MKINAAITISRDYRDWITISIEDRASHASFVKVSMTPHDFMLALMGLSHVEATETVVRDLAVVGMQRITEDRSIVCPLSTYDRGVIREWLCENGKEDGWIINPYLGSQGSIVCSAGVTTLYYRVYRYEPCGDYTTEKEAN